MNKKIGIIIAVASGLFLWFRYVMPPPSLNLSAPRATPSNFEECVALGNPIMESYPRQCREGDTTFTEDIGNTLKKSDLIQLESPLPNSVISSPLILTGKARGTWYFEASFPVEIKDSSGKSLGSVPAQAQSDWMTTDFVPFKATLEFSAPETATGTLILRKDNPSGLPEKDDALIIPIKFMRDQI